MTDKNDFEIKEGEENFVCVLDILGFSALIGSQNRSKRLEAIIQTITEQLEFDFEVHPWLSYIFISDTIIIACKKKYFPHLIWKACQIQAKLLEIGFASRGGIEFGDVFTIAMNVKEGQRASSFNIFGRAYINAHKLEKDSAKYPRDLISREALNAGEAVHKGSRLLIDQDQDGWAYVNPFKRIVHYECMTNPRLHSNYDTPEKKLIQLNKWADVIDKQIADIAKTQAVCEKWWWL
jgi:hypothetical protein